MGHHVVQGGSSEGELNNEEAVRMLFGEKPYEAQPHVVQIQGGLPEKEMMRLLLGNKAPAGPVDLHHVPYVEVAKTAAVEHHH